MRPQLKFLLPDIKVANQASEALLLARIDNKNICFLAKPGTDLGQLQPANTFESTNLINNGEKGILVGALIGLIAGLVTHFYFPSIPESLTIHWMILVGALMVLGAALSALGAGLFGVNFFNTDLKKYKSKIDEGAILMIVSAPFQRSSEISKIISKLHLKF
jgi:hypothetical protein